MHGPRSEPSAAPLAYGPASASLSLLGGVDAVTFLSVRSITWFFTV